MPERFRYQLDPWDVLLRAWLHDPPDKAADIPGHFQRALSYARAALHQDVSASELDGALPDQLASAYERLPMPDARGRYDQLGVSAVDGELTVFHPLSAETRTIHLPLDPEKMCEILDEVTQHADSAKVRFLSLWRSLPERLAQWHAGFALAPAETRNPDHTIWHHLDTTAAMAWALHGGKGKAALLAFKIGPVQPFIEAARSIRDLLSGSYLISELAFAAIEPVLHSCGPTALIYPSLRGVPLMDFWLSKQGVRLPPPASKKLARPSIPHRFLALVPVVLADELKCRVVEAALERWRHISGAIRRRLKERLDIDWRGWDRLWEAQIDSFFDVRATAMPMEQLDFERLIELEDDPATTLVALRGPGADVHSSRGGQKPGAWQRYVSVSRMLMDAQVTVRHIPDYKPHGDVPQKCTLLGTYEQMGPSRLSESRRFFEQGLGLEKETDRLCAISLTKRFAFPSYFHRQYGLDPDDYRFDDTRQFANRARKPGEKEYTYYAILMMDGDEMGKWLSGAKSPCVHEVLHPKILDWHKRNGIDPEVLKTRRPVSPALHAAISDALNRFATGYVPEIVEAHQGVLIYSGGDDVLAAVPVSHALACARSLRQKFSSYEVMGSRASMSAGLVIAHSKEDLRVVLRAGREAEKNAKQLGRDRLTIAVLRRSGEHASASCCWEYVRSLERQVKSFRGGNTDRWAYQLRQLLPVFNGLPAEAFRAELRRRLAHMEHGDPLFSEDFASYLAQEKAWRQTWTLPGVLRDFLTLCQSASFITRGRD